MTAGLFPPEIREFPRTAVIGMQEPFTQETVNRIPELWQRFHARAGEISNATGAAAYGVSFVNDPVELNFDYLAASEVSDLTDIPEGMVGREIGGNLAAIFTLELKGQSIGGEIGAAYRNIWRNWIPTADFVPAAKYDFERYDDRFDSATLTGSIEIVIPVKPRND